MTDEPRCACCMLPVSQCYDHEFDQELERIDREKNTGLTCPNCDASCVEYAPVEERFEYGAVDPVTLAATVVKGDCRACGFQWTDERAEIARDAAVRKHLQERG